MVDSKFLTDAPCPIVALCEHQNRFFLATQQRVYELVDGVWHPMVFVNEQEGMAFGKET